MMCPVACVLLLWSSIILISLLISRLSCSSSCFALLSSRASSVSSRTVQEPGGSVYLGSISLSNVMKQGSVLVSLNVSMLMLHPFLLSLLGQLSFLSGSFTLRRWYCAVNFLWFPRLTILCLYPSVLICRRLIFSWCIRPSYIWSDWYTPCVVWITGNFDFKKYRWVHYSSSSLNAV